MAKADAWTGDSFPLSAYLDDVDPGVDTAILIAEKSTSITVRRKTNTLSAQTVRLETLRGDRQIQTAAGTTYNIDALILGYKGHPTITNTDLQSGDRFRADGRDYEVIAVMPATPNSLQAYARIRE